MYHDHLQLFGDEELKVSDFIHVTHIDTTHTHVDTPLNIHYIHKQTLAFEKATVSHLISLFIFLDDWDLFPT